MRIVRSKELPQGLWDNCGKAQIWPRLQRSFCSTQGSSRSTVASIILKWKRFVIPRILPRPGRPGKLRNRGRRALIGETKDSQTMKNKILLSDETKIELEKSRRCSSPAQYNPNSNTWWWQHHAMGGCFSAAGTEQFVAIEGKTMTLGTQLK